MVPFAGWEMAVQFEGLMAEHRAVRQRCGVFDISHMGVLTLTGPGVKDNSRAWCPAICNALAPVKPNTRCCSMKPAASATT